MRIIDLFEKKKNKKSSTGDASNNNDSPTYKLHISNKFKKARVKYSNKPSNTKLVDNLLKTLKDTGIITTNNVHRIREPLPSTYTSSKETGWMVVWISRSDDLRLAYKVFPDNVIEVKFGTASDIGYSH